MSSTANRVKAEEIGNTGEEVPLTGIDQMMGDSYVANVFVYQQTLDPKVLVQSLSKALSNFPIFSGRLITTEGTCQAIRCNNGGVTFTVHELSYTLDETNLQTLFAKQMTSLTHMNRPYASADKDVPLFAIKLNQLKGGGSILGISFAHCLADMPAFFTFMQAWSDASNGRELPQQNVSRQILNELAERHDGKVATGLERYEVIGMLKGIGIALKQLQYKFTSAHKVFHVTTEQLVAIKSEAQADQTDAEQWVSSQDALVARVWRSIIKYKPASASTKLMNVVNFRGRSDTNVKLAPDYIGNAVSTRYTHLPNREFQQLSTYQIARLLRQQYGTVNAETIGQDLAYLNKRRNNLGKKILLGFILDMLEDGFMVNNWSCFDFNAIDLGFGRPIWYNPPVWGLTNLLHIISAPDGVTGYHLHLQMPKKELKGFANDFPREVISA